MVSVYILHNMYHVPAPQILAIYMMHIIIKILNNIIMNNNILVKMIIRNMNIACRILCEYY